MTRTPDSHRRPTVASTIVGTRTRRAATPQGGCAHAALEAFVTQAGPDQPR